MILGALAQFVYYVDKFINMQCIFYAQIVPPYQDGVRGGPSGQIDLSFQSTSTFPIIIAIFYFFSLLHFVICTTHSIVKIWKLKHLLQMVYFSRETENLYFCNIYFLHSVDDDFSILKISTSILNDNRLW